MGKTGKYGTTDQQETFTAYKFWQYDPIGQVDAYGNVSFYQFYIDQIKARDYAPINTGKSPYVNIR